MDLNNFNLLSQTIYHCVAGLSFLAAALWFIITTKAKKRIQLDVDAVIFDATDNHYICEAHIIIENRGHVPHKIYDMALSLRGLRDDMEEPVIETKNGSINLGEKIGDTKSITNSYYFIRPGVKQVIKHNLLIPKEYKLISILCGFTYKKRTYNVVKIAKYARKRFRKGSDKSINIIIDEILNEIQVKGALFSPFDDHNHPHRASKIISINENFTR
jgi:hypothetical protein